MITPNQWFLQIKGLIAKIADENYQRKSWLSEGKPEEMSTWDEFLCNLFDDYNFDDFVDGTSWEDAGLNADQHSMLIELRESINDASNQLGDYPSPEDVLKNSAWKKSILSAQKFLESI